MRLSIPRSDLARLLASTTKVVEARNTIPILGCVRLVVAVTKKKATLTVTATDMDVEITAALPVDGEAGSVCVSAALLDSIVKKLPADALVDLTLADNTLTVKAGRSRFSLQTLPADDFPNFTQGNYTAEFEADLAALFEPVKFAISTEETRYYLNGIYLVGTADKLTAVATDGHRLSKHEGTPVAPFDGIIVPRKMVGLVPKGAIHVSLSDTKIRFQTADAVITSKLIDGTFPDYQRVIPQNNDKIVTFDGGTMAKAADRVSVVSSERGRAVKLSFTEGQATLVVNNPENGNAAEDVVVSYSDEPIDVGFNSAYLAELVGQFPAGDISLALADGGSPAVFTSAKAAGLICILMPMRVGA